MPELNQVAHPRPLETAQYRAARSFMIDKNKSRRLEAGDEDVVRRQVAVNISRAMQSRDLGAERAQHDAPRNELRALQVTHDIETVDPRGHDYFAAATALGAKQQNFRNSNPVSPQMLR